MGAIPTRASDNSHPENALRNERTMEMVPIYQNWNGDDITGEFEIFKTRGRIRESAKISAGFKGSP